MKRSDLLVFRQQLPSVKGSTALGNMRIPRSRLLPCEYLEGWPPALSTTRHRASIPEQMIMFITFYILGF